MKRNIKILIILTIIILLYNYKYIGNQLVKNNIINCNILFCDSDKCEKYCVSSSCSWQICTDDCNIACRNKKN